MKTKNKTTFKPGDWVKSSEIFTPAYVRKVLKHGKKLLVVYGAYKEEVIVAAKSCSLIKKA